MYIMAPRVNHLVDFSRNQRTISNIFLITCCLLFAQALAQRDLSKTLHRVHIPDVDEIVPQGAASLAFVFDITGSMYDDLVQVIEGAAKILATTKARREAPLYNYVLVPFHDPDVGPVVVTKDDDAFQDKLRNLYVQGGGDCPEMSITAIREALNVSLPNSFIYVFTDARSKDYDQTKSVLKLIQEKQSQIVFVMTGDCGNTSHPGYKAYEQIASTSSGQIFLLKKSEVNQVLNFVRVAVQSRKVNLLSTDRHTTDTQTVELPVDTKLQEFTISLSGDTPNVQIYDPQNNLLTPDTGLIQILDIKKILISTVKSPKPGIWKVKLGANGPHTVRITGISKLDIVHGFSKKPVDSLKNTKPRPIQGIPTYLLVNATDLSKPGRVTQIQLVDIHGNIIKELPVTYNPNNPSLYKVAAFKPPNQFFYIRARGRDDKGYIFQRNTRTSINPEQPLPPVVRMPEVTKGHYERESVITCSVTSEIPFSVQWSRDGKKIGSPSYFRESANAIWSIRDASVYSEGLYRCNATSDAGWGAADTLLDVTDPPPNILPPANVTVIPGDHAILTCHAFSTVAFNMSWYRARDAQNLAYLDATKYFVYTNGSMEIGAIEKSDEGPYICRASNEGGDTEAVVYLTVQEAPQASVTPVTQDFKTGDTVSIQCQARGSPSVFVWRQNGLNLEKNDKVDFDLGLLTLKNLVRSDEGEYECVAVNPAGTDYATATINYIEVPTVTVPQEIVLVKNGDTATLTCNVDGIPKPNVTWHKGGVQLQEYSFVRISGGELRLIGVQDYDEGSYMCVATNAAGSTTGTVTLEVGDAPRIERGPKSIGIDILTNSSLPCSAQGYPTPKILWRREDGTPIDFGGRFRQLPSGALAVYGIQKEDEGVYICSAQNQFGVKERSAYIEVTGIVAPLIAFTSNKIEAQEGRAVRFPCFILAGNPPPKLTWMKNGVVVVPEEGVYIDDENSLHIDSVLAADEGNYTCHASNVGGNATYTTNLDVHVPPRLSSKAKYSYIVNQGKHVVLHCEVTGEPMPMIDWYKNSVQIQPTDRHYMISESGNLEIFSAEPDDTAGYSCTATNIAGKQTKNMDLFVRIPPRIKSDVNRIIVTVNKPIILPCEVTAIPRALVRWMKDGSDLDRTNQEIEVIPDLGLRFPRTQTSDAGLYECHASNEAGNATKLIRLIVQVPPKIITNGPGKVTVLKGDRVELPCATTGDPQPMVIWKKDDKELTVLDTDQGYMVLESGTLFIDKAKISHTALYTCVAENPAGKATRDVELIVHDPPKIPTDTPKNTSVIESRKAILPCPAYGTPPPIIEWYKDGVLLTGNEIGVRILGDGSLVFDSTQASDAGAYECVARNVAGNWSHVIEFKVYVPPRIKGSGPGTSTEVPRTIIKVNESVTLECPTTAIPLPKITWYKDGVLLNIDENERFTTSDRGQKLRITDSQLVDTARYTCKAENIAGKTEKKVDLEVQEPPSIDPQTATDANNSVIVNQTFIIDCPAGGTPVPKITWYKDGYPIDESDGNIRILDGGKRLRIVKAEVANTGTFKCRAVNNAGEHEREYKLHVLVPPKIDDSDEVAVPEVILNRTATILCPATGIPDPVITWYKDNVEITGNTNRLTILANGRRLQIRNAQVSDTGRYSCRAKNVAGETKKYFDLNVLVPPTIDQANVVKDPKVIVNNPITINCPVSGIPTPEIKWLKNGEEFDVNAHPNARLLSNGRQLQISIAKVSDTGIYRCFTYNKAGNDSLDINLRVLVPSFINTTGINLKPRIIVNDTYDLDCPVSGIPTPDIVWLKDGFPIAFELYPNLKVLDNGQKLRLLKSQVEDTGLYTCRAQNEAGETEKDYDVQIWVPPKIIVSRSEDAEPKVIENRTITILCPAEGVPAPNITWYRNGQKLNLDVNPNFDITDYGRKLTINNAQVLDTSRYTCEATNNAGKAAQDYDLDVWVPPHLVDYRVERNLTVIKGRSKILRCPIVGTPNPKIRWFKQNRPIYESGRIHFLSEGRQLEILNSQESDTSDYTCSAENVAGSMDIQYKLQVWVPPSIDDSNLVDEPKVVINRTVILECPVDGIPPPTVKWLKNGFPLKQTEHLKMLDNNRQIEILRAQETDTARYICIAKNEAGELRQTFDLEVLVPPSIDASLLDQELSVIQNRTVYIDCPAVGIPKPSIMWLKGRQPLLDFPYKYISQSADGTRLTIRNAQVSDTETYTCRATNVAGRLDTKFSLEVYTPPEIDGANYYPYKINVTVSDAISIRCDTKGIPKPEIIWYKDGTKIDPEDPEYRHMRIHSDGQLLEIISAKVSDKAIYKCFAENAAGRSEKSYDLEVFVPPTIPNSDQLETITVIINRAKIIECPATGIPPPKIEWLRDGRKIAPLAAPNLQITNDGRELRILNAQLVDMESYTCIASNPAGLARKSFYVDVLVPPEIETGPTAVEAIVDTRTALRCETIGRPDPEVTWTKDGLRIPRNGLRYRMQGTGTLRFATVKVEDSGSYTCTAKNSAGTATRTIKLQVIVPPTLLTKHPMEISALQGSSVWLPCKASGIPEPEYSWQKGARLLSNSFGSRRLLENGTLRLENLQTHHKGTYICIAQNSAGTVIGHVLLSVLVPPSIEEQRTTQYKIIAGRGLIIPCIATGIPKPKIHWMKDGVEIPANDFNFRLLRDGGLAIPISKSTDTGRFTCTAENEAGRATIDVSLQILVQPSITGDQRIFIEIEGSTAFLPCTTEGVPPPEITWRKDFTTIIDTEGKFKILPNGTLQISDVKAQNEGSYLCSAKNEAGRDSRESLLRVQVPPRIILIPQDQDVTAGSRITLECEATGTPTPVISWRLNNVEIASPPSTGGRSRLVVDNAMKDDQGTYSCVAENPAGVRKAVAAVQVKVPPRILLPPGNKAVTLASRVILSCPVIGDPPPKITWTKNNSPVKLNNRVQQLANGSLVIYDSNSADGGEYKCVASNDAGTSEGVAMLTIKKRPDFKIAPKDMVIDQGSTLTWDCVGEGEPEPKVQWKRNGLVLGNMDRISILPNSSLRILTVQLSDSGIYSCFAKNELGGIVEDVKLTVVVHGRFSPWSDWSECSVTCGQGRQARKRACDNPRPVNGGRECVGPTRESRICNPKLCQVDGGWNNWGNWEPCSTTCGTGERIRRRRCDNPLPKFGGRTCEGEGSESVICNLRPCPVDGEWGTWTPWQPCSVTCGMGVQEKYRRCDSPRAQNGGRECYGENTERRRCKVRQCEIHGNWGQWAAWSACSFSCGGGTKERVRRCDSPQPQYGGRFCLGKNTERDYCNTHGCPIHGNWAQWSVWGDCSATCGGGVRKRFRTCSEPAPKNGGRACPGISQMMEKCNDRRCPEDGRWGEWGQWTTCTKTCGTGTQMRHRTCAQARFGGKACRGDGTQVQKCNIIVCGVGFPTRARGSVIGNINEVDFGVSALAANISRTGTGTMVTADLHNIPRNIGPLMEHLISILTPIYWTTALEIGEASNGFTLTKGDFKREVQVEFATGEILKMTHIATGVDDQGSLNLDIVANGYVPELPPTAEITVEPYIENYIQTGPGAIYAKSSRMFRVGNYILPYHWNHSITYDPDFGKMPYLVQTLSADALQASFSPSREVMRYQVSAQIAKGDPSNRCPEGFNLDPTGPYCTDDDECVRLDPCSHYCHNSPGSFSCSCPPGLSLDVNGRTCKDQDECDLGIYKCHKSQDCLNTIGSYRCVVRCGAGFRRTAGGLSCQDINECREFRNPCDQTCLNLIGSYRCACRRGYRLSGRHSCADINECASKPCSHECINTIGSFRCTCPAGFELMNGGICRDIDECALDRHNCQADTECQNTQGSFQCVKTCPRGLRKAANGSCVDVDECTTGVNRCHYNQICINSYGGYRCACPQGYKSSGPGKPCRDINECIQSPNPCTYHCRNIPGDFECICPPGMKRLADKKSCAGLEFLGPEEVINTAKKRDPYRNNYAGCFGNVCGFRQKFREEVRCPPGYQFNKAGDCIDYDECQQRGRCQHKCHNTQGSFTCSCPDGYRLAANGRTCTDIDECKEQRVNCGPNKLCFNRHGDYQCIETVCPPNYERDENGACVLPCKKTNQPCPTNSKYADIIEFRTVSLPSGIPAYQDLIRLIAYNQYGVQLPNTRFDIIENDPHIPFQIKLTEDGKGVVFTIKPLEQKAMYQIKVQARSYDHTKVNLMYRTTFIIHIAVSAFPY